MPDGLVLRTRLAVTQRNLERVNDLNATIDRREQGMSDLLSGPEELKKHFEQVWAPFEALSMIERGLEDENFTNQLDKLYGVLRSHQRSIKKAASEATALRTELFDQLYERQDVKDYLVRQAEEKRSALGAENYWDKRSECERLFSEYVDVLRGIALRGARFGDQDLALGDFFRIADELPRVWGRPNSWSWDSLVVPALLEVSHSTDVNILHVGFPEWTIWALPLIQHEFGHMFLDRVTGSADADASSIRTSMVADALACLVTGPAYACASLLLRLDPAAVTLGADVALRSATILATLQAVAAEVSDLGPVQKLAERLGAEWRVAVDAAGGSADAFDAALGSDDCREAVDQARDTLRDCKGALDPHWPENWGRISSWADALADGTPDQMDIAEEDFRDRDRASLVLVLNAAWLARVRPDPRHDAPPEKVEEIGRLATTSMLEHLPPQEPRQIKQTGQPNLR